MDGTIGEIKMYTGDFIPHNWLPCDGRVMSQQTYRPLFNVIGFEYGQTGTTSFHLPDLRTRVPMGAGSGKNLSSRKPGQTGGEDSTRLETKNLPPLMVEVSSANATIGAATDGVSIATPGIDDGREFVPALGFNMEKPNVTLNAGGSPSQEMTNRQSYVVAQYLICVQGALPTTD
ncbi:MAG: tail fiber protein [Gilvibacter sp.]